ncbi:3-oxoacyl-acyl-carrier protein reductase [Candidatus Purcelliella pentastirinorum]|uniref:3-oxoacyl-[acyl-carrier-protein] reductase n=1 Tax=Candidatus Purcelliella pentastirinorum TaxID=472834 RepID=A0A346DZF8_9ENTR|nr:3-oxoacyl-[acyl-carrier-protein] reductase [Candidatus Purcelliella pentastirinorum]AXN02113.1 3-oxoacyl-acyl-carrier protein reductase [Candidatus Purcelliella pentastirinorum]
MNLKNKIALITGATNGIGHAIAYVLKKYGAFIIGTATNNKNVNKIEDFLKNKGKGYLLDVNDKKSIINLLNDIKKNFGKIDILINNAAITIDKLFIKMNEQDWQNVINTNLNSIFYISKAVIFSMLKKKQGRIISIGSMIANTGNIGQANYSASKAGLIAMSKSIAKEVASRGITVNVVSPGFIKTNMTKKIKEKISNEILKNIPMKRFGSAKDVAYAVAFLASDKASYITGETIHINGGLYMS